MVGVCDLDLARAQSIGQRFNIPAAFDSAEAMLQETQPDVVHVLLPPELHAIGAEKCLTAGSHIFVEKPFCITVEECRRVLAVAQRNGLQVGVNHNITYMPAFLELIKAAREWRLGAIEHVQVMFANPMPGLERGVHTHWMFGATDHLMLELGPHPMSICTRLLGRPVGASTAVSGELTLSNGVRFFRQWLTSLACERGTAQVTMSVGSGYYGVCVLVIGEDAQAFVDIRRNTFQILEKTPYRRLDDMVNGFRNAFSLARQSVRNLKMYTSGAMTFGPRYEQQGYSFRASIAAFYRSLAAGRTPRIDGAEGTAVIEACEMAIESAFTYMGHTEERSVAV